MSHFQLSEQALYLLLEDDDLVIQSKYVNESVRQPIADTAAEDSTTPQSQATTDVVICTSETLTIEQESLLIKMLAAVKIPDSKYHIYQQVAPSQVDTLKPLAHRAIWTFGIEHSGEPTENLLKDSTNILHFTLPPVSVVMHQEVVKRAIWKQLQIMLK